MGPNGTSECKGCKLITICPYNGYCTVCLDKGIKLLKQPKTSKTTREIVYQAIDDERNYQNRVWGDKKLPTPGEIILVHDYLRQLERHYTTEPDGAYIDIPYNCVHDLRKIAAIIVRALEHIVPLYPIFRVYSQKDRLKEVHREENNG